MFQIKESIDIHKKTFTDSDNNVFLTVDTLIDMKKIITGSRNITLRKI